MYSGRHGRLVFVMHDPFPAASSSCPSCGAANPADANFCQECGTPLGRQSSADTVAIRPADLAQLKEKAEHTAPAHTITFRTDIGKKHHTNQDAGGAWTWLRADGTPVSLLVVADGVSAGRRSEEASRLTVEIINQRLVPILQDASRTADDVLATLIRAVKDANHEVSARPHAAVANADATTVVAAAVIGDEVVGTWVGDTRVYLIRGGSARRLTRDHSWAESVVSSGLMTEEQAARDPRAHMILRWLGPPDQEDPGVEVFRTELRDGDVVLCCTDGLYMYFSPPSAQENEIAGVIEETAPGLDVGTETLLNMALQRGGYDNITVAALRLDGGRPVDAQDEQPVAGQEREIPPGEQTVRFSFPKREDSG